MNKFSTEDLLEFHYREMTPEKSQKLAQCLKEDWSLQQKMEVIKQASERLDKSIERPRAEAVDHILKYAAAYTAPTAIEKSVF